MQEIQVIEKGCSEILISKLRQVRMLHNEDAYPYKHASISIEQLSLDLIVPPQTYVLKKELLEKRSLYFELLKKGHNIFHLDGYLRLRIMTQGNISGTFDKNEEIVDLLPPIVEESFENNSRVICLINDGMHRLYLARLLGIIPHVVYIRGIPKQYPYYAYPIIGGWDKVEIKDDLPKGFIKKWHRIENYKTLYRNFNSAFANTSKPRGHFSLEKA